MRSVLLFIIAAAQLAGPAFAQSTMTPTRPEQQTRPPIAPPGSPGSATFTPDWARPFPQTGPQIQRVDPQRPALPRDPYGDPPMTRTR